MYRFNAEDPGQSLYTPTIVGVTTHLISYYLTIFEVYVLQITEPFLRCKCTFDVYMEEEEEEEEEEELLVAVVADEKGGRRRRRRRRRRNHSRGSEG